MRVMMRLLAVLWALFLPLPLAAQEDSDRGFIQGLLEDALSGPDRTVRIEGFAGALSSRATIDRITVSDPDGIWLTVSDVSMVWTRTALVRGRIDINEISVGQVDLPRLPLPSGEEAPAPEAGTPFALPELPVALILEQLSVDEVVLGQALFGEAARVSVSGSANLEGGEGHARLSVNRLDKGGEVELDGSYSNGTRILSLDLSVAEPADGIAANLLNLPGRPSVALTVNGEGEIDDFEAALRLETDGEERLSGQVVLHEGGESDLRRFRLDVGGDIAPLLAPDYREFLGDEVQLVAEAAQGADGSLSLDELNLQAEALTLSGQATIGGDGWPRSLDLRGRIAPPSGDEVLLPLPGSEIWVQGVDLTGTFDAEESNGWRLEARVAGFRQEEVQVDTLSLTGGGEISRVSNRATGSLQVDASGLDLRDAALAEAVGTSLRGALRFDWQPGTPLILDEIDLAGADYGLTGAVTISALDTLNPLVNPDITLRADDVSRFAALAGTELTGAVNVAIDGGIEPLSGAFDIEIDGTTRDLGTGIAQVDPLLAGVGKLRLDARRDTGGLIADTLEIVTQAARIEGQAQLATDASTARITARIEDTSVVLPGITGASTLDLSAEQSGPVWQIGAEAQVPGAADISYDGTVTTGRPDGTQIAGVAEAAITRLSAFSDLVGRQLSGSAQLRVEGSGVIEAQTFDLSLGGTAQDVELSVPTIDPILAGRTGIRFVGSRDETGRIDVDELRIEGAANATYTGWISGDSVETLAADGRLTADLPELARFSGVAGRDLSGAATVDLEAEGKLLDGPLSVSGIATARDVGLSMPDIDPILSGETRVDFAVMRDADGVYEVTRLQTRGAVDATFDGLLRGSDVESLAVDGRLTADLPELSRFSGLAGLRLSGSAALDVEAAGQLVEGPLSVSATVTAQDVGLSMAQVDSLMAETTRIELVARRDADGRIEVSRFETSGAVDASYTGTLRQLEGDVELDGTLTADVPRLSAFAGLVGVRLGGSARLRADVRGQAVEGPLSVDASVTGENISTGIATLDPMLRGTTQVDLVAARDASGTFRIDRAVLDASGLDATVSGQYAPSAASLNVSLRVADLGRIVPELPGPATVNGTLGHSGGPWQVDLDGSGPGGIGGSVQGSVAQGFSTANIEVIGSAPLALADAYLDGQVVTGILRYDIRVNGPLALSSVSGTVSTSDARFAFPAYGLILSGVTGDVRLSGGRANVNMGASLSTGGQVRATGTIALSPPFAGDLAIELVNAQLEQAGLVQTTANGRVTVVGPLTGGARIGGQIDLGQVELRIPNFGPSYSALDGLRHVNTPADVQRTLVFAGLDGSESGGGAGGPGAAGPSYPIDLVVNAPDRIFVRGRGLDAELGGSLRLTGTTSNMVPIGRFELIRGRLDLLGRRLALTDGSVSLRGSFDPYISFGATTTVEDTAITIRIEGFASEPDLEVTSDPTLPEDEALSFFLFGRSVTNLSPLQAVQLAAAVRTLSGQGGLGLTGQLREGLGVDDLDIGTDAEGNAQARVGKYISENIYTDVAVDSQGQSEINLNIDVNDNVTVRGRVGSDGTSGIGIFYERDY